MAEIRINATGGVKLYDADDSHYAQIIAGTITSNVDALTLGHASADFNIPVKVLGTTPTLTIGDAGAEDTKIVFDGNAQDFYIALDDSADDLLIGLGSTVGTTPIISIDENKLSTFSGAVTVGVDDTGHDVKLFGATAGSYWLWDESADGVVQIGTITVGVNDAGHDVKFFGDAASAYMLWDTSADDLILAGGAGLIVPDGQFTLGSTAVTTTAAELNLLDGGTSVGSSITIADADGFVVNDGGTMKTIPATDIPTYVGGGITMCDTWGHSANQAISANAATLITGYTNWGSTNGGGSIGSALTVSSGIFTFPETGYYYLSYEFQVSNAGSSANDGSTIYLETTVNNSTYTDACDPTSFFADANDHIGLGSSFIFDVTDTANIKFKFVAYSADTDMTVAGHTTRLRSGFNVIRLGDT
jgi:hypothetical protein